MGAHDTLMPECEQVVSPAADARDFAPEMSEVHAEHAFVRVEQRGRIEIQPRHRRDGLQRREYAALFPDCRGRHAEHSEPPRRREDAEPLLERIATDRVENELDALAA